MTLTLPDTDTTLTGVDLAEAIRRTINEHPERFDMGSWAADKRPGVQRDPHPVCGTTMCLAGWAVVLNGGRPVFNQRSSDRTYWMAEDAIMPDGRRVDIADEGAGLLGIESTSVFYGDEDDATWWLDQYIETGEPPAEVDR